MDSDVDDVVLADGPDTTTGKAQPIYDEEVRRDPGV
jgi:hypothetical protein